MNYLNILPYILIALIGFTLGYFGMGYNKLGFWIVLILVLIYGIVNEMKGSSSAKKPSEVKG